MNKIEFSNQNGSLTLTVSPDKFEAYLTLKSSDFFYNEEEISELIALTGINTGFQEAREYLRRQGILRLVDKPFLIAKGIMPTLPNAVYRLKEHLQAITYQTLITKQKEPNQLGKPNYVTAGVVLGNAELEGEITPGISVFGEEVGIENPMALLVGKNVVYDLEKKQFVAETNGYLHIDEKRRLSISERIELDGELQIGADEKLTFVGDLCIGGDLLGNSSLTVFGNLEVGGSVIETNLYVTGNMVVKNQICQANICVDSSLSALSVKDSRVCAGDVITLSNGGDNSFILAENLIEIDKGIVDKCSLFAGSSTIANSVRSSSKLAITVAPYLKESYVRLKGGFISDSDPNRIAELEKELAKRYAEIDYADKSITIKGTIEKGSQLRILKYKKAFEKEGLNLVITIDEGKLVVQNRRL
jgi:hypothetical protein